MFSHDSNERCAVELAIIAICSMVQLSAAELGGAGSLQIDYSSARQEAEQAISKFQVAEGLRVGLVAHEPHLLNPVAFCIDEQGRVFVSETGRYRSSTLDIRHYMDWYLDDLACRTVDDRVAMMRKYLGADYRKLGVETERIRLLEDRDGDGFAEASQIYASGFTNVLGGIASGVLARKGDVYFTNIPNLWKLSDTDQDGRADERAALSTGYGVRFSLTGHDLHGLKFGPDGRLYFTVGDRGADVLTKEGERLSYPDEGVCFRCNPDGSDLEVFARGLRNPQELAFNEYGDLFTGENDCDHGDRERWVHIVEGSDSGWRVGYQFSEQNPGGVWNAEGLWHLRFPGQAAYLLPPLAHIDNGPSGLVYYPGTGLSEAYRQHFFLCHFKGLDTVSGIKAFRLASLGASYSVGEVKKVIWNVMPTDVDFGPDGALYFSDWVEGWPKSERGRIYRLTHPDTQRSAAARDTARRLASGFDHLSEANLVSLLAHPDMRVRQEAQFEFADRGRSSRPHLLGVLRDSEDRLARIHAVWGLDQVARQGGAVDTIYGALAGFLDDADAEVRAQIAKVLGAASRATEMSARLVPLLSDDSARVRYFAALSLGRLGAVEHLDALLQMIRSNDDKDLYLRHAGVMALTMLGDRSGVREAASDESVAVRMAALLTLRRWEDPTIGAFLSDPEPLLVVEAARAINDVPIPEAMENLADASVTVSVVQLRSSLAPEIDLVTPAIRRMINANYRLGAPRNAANLIALAERSEVPEALRAEALERVGQWGDPSPRDQVVGLYRPVAARSGEAVRPLLAEAFERFLNDDSETIAVAAAQAAGDLGLTSSAGVLGDLVVDLSAPTPLRVVALRTLSQLESDRFPTALAAAQNDFAAELRKEATRLQANIDPSLAAPQLNAVLIDGSLAEQQIALATLATINGSVADEIILRWFGKLVDKSAPPELGLDLLEAAMVRSDARIVESLAKWRAGLPADDSLGEYRLATLGGDAANGRRVFVENPIASCTRCHRWGEVGSDVGPSMDGVGKRLNREQLLEAIIDPNRTTAEGFETVVVTLKDDSVQAGIVKEETEDALVLNLVGEEPVRLSKANIVSRETGLSGMPEGLGELLSKRDLRDLVAFLAELD